MNDDTKSIDEMVDDIPGATAIGDVAESIGNNLQEMSNTNSRLGIGGSSSGAMYTTTTSSSEPRSYKCPNCRGEFNNWDTMYRGEDLDGLRKPNILTHTARRNATEVHVCPFCQTAKGDY